MRWESISFYASLAFLVLEQGPISMFIFLKDREPAGLNGILFIFKFNSSCFFLSGICFCSLIELMTVSTFSEEQE